MNMNIRSLRNILRITETGSLTAAATNAHLTVQAISAQLNKIEDHYGFALFDRNSKGLTLTDAGRAIMPRIRELIAASGNLDESIAEIRGQNRRQLRIAMNTTLGQEAMSRLLDHFMALFTGYDIQFSAGETHENLRGVSEKKVDLAVFLGSPPEDLPYVELDGFEIEVVSASTSTDVLKRASERKDRFLVRPNDSCPYSVGFTQFVDQKLPGMSPEFIESRTILSASEHLTVTLVRQIDGIGILSRDVARKGNLAILPDFEVRLPVRLAVDATKLEGAIGQRLRSLNVKPLAVCANIDGKSAIQSVGRQKKHVASPCLERN
ncbi:LysR family transcriptional regulator [Agrobacterium vitis]|nr:LysR family transcriptional regulator [Agrobacterium vitis]